MEQVNEKDFAQNIGQLDLVVVDFYADWCGPCQMLKPVLEQLASEERDVKFLAVNVDQNLGLARKYGVMSIPCVVFFQKGEEVNRNVGFAPKTVLQDILKGLKK